MSSSITRMFRKGVVKGLGLGKWEENPLVTIGLTATILDLGFTNDDLFEICRRIARVMLERFHEDRAGHEPRVKDLQGRFSAAFTILKDRTSFDLALEEFSFQQSQDRTDANRHRRDIQRAEKDTRIEEERVKEALGRVETISRQLVEEQKARQADRFGLEKAVQKIGEERLRGARILFQAARYITMLSNQPQDTAGGVNVSLDTPTCGLSLLTFRLVEKATRAHERLAADHPELSSEITQGIEQLSRSLRSVRCTPGEFEITFERVRVDHGLFEKRVFPRKERRSVIKQSRVLGSIPIGAIGEVASTATRDLGFHIKYEALFGGLDTRINPGSLLVAVSLREPNDRVRRLSAMRPRMPRVFSYVLEVKK